MDLSIIIPVYNCKPWLTACVESIRRAGLPEYEIVLVDDGSTDGSGALCDRLALEHPEIRVFHQENGGVSSARNRGLREASGEYVLFVDGDDSFDSSLLSRLPEDMRNARADLILFGMTFDYYHRGKCYRRSPMVYEYDGMMPLQMWGGNLAQLFARNALSPVWNKLYRRKILMEHGLELKREMFLYEDLEFSLRYLACCDGVYNVPKAIYHYRQSEDEGNAGRRLARIDHIADVVTPIETALENLRKANPAVSEGDAGRILLSLYQVLAREKITVSGLEGTRQICREYAQWCTGHGFEDGENRFHRLLMGGKAERLLLLRYKTALRHWAAVRVKSLLGGRKI